MYQYYRPVQITEHCLRAEEIAIIFGIFTTSNKPHAMAVGALLKENNAAPYYYESSKGLLKGYLFMDYYPIVTKFLKDNPVGGRVSIGSKGFNVSLKPRLWCREQLINNLNSLYPTSRIIEQP